MPRERFGRVLAGVGEGCGEALLGEVPGGGALVMCGRVHSPAWLIRWEGVGQGRGGGVVVGLRDMKGLKKKKS